MQNLWGDLVNQVAFVDYNPWENVYDSNESQISKPVFRFMEKWMFVGGMVKLTPCDTDYKSILSPGNFKEMNIEKLWNSDVYNNLRQKV